MRESELLKLIQLHATKLGSRLLRNQVGKYKLDDGRYLTSGLGVGSSDLVGFTPIRISQDMVGQTLAIFTAVEVKTCVGKITSEQQRFIEAVQKAGGIAFVARSVDELSEGLKWHRDQS